MNAVRWIELEGAENVRDVGGLPTEDGGRIRARQLIRSDSTRDMTPADVRLLVDELGVRTVADLRTEVELQHEGPDLVDAEPGLSVHHLSLFPEPSRDRDGDGPPGDPDDAPVVLPWEERDDDFTEDAGGEDGGTGGGGTGGGEDAGGEGGSPDRRRRGTSGVYLRYLDERADSILASLRLIAHQDGATLVHCAAGKDRTGTVVAFALREVGVTRQAVVADYVRSAERIEAIFARLGSRRTYAANIEGSDIATHAPRAVTMERLLDAVDDEFGGVHAWLRQHGWTDSDARALRGRLVAENA